MTRRAEAAPLEIPEGWYLMSTTDLEEMLHRRRSGSIEPLPPSAVHLTTEAALSYRNAGNLPDERGRTLRLLLHVSDRNEARALPSKRALFEPDYLDAPTWRKPGSVAVNVVPLRAKISASESTAWWDDPDLAALESEWARSGAIDGLQIPADYRGFVYKTILSLRAAERAVTIENVMASLARWLRAEEVGEVRAALEEANWTKGR